MFKVIESSVPKGEKELANSILNSTSNSKEVMSENPGMKNSLMKHSAAGSTMALYMTKVVTQGPEMGRRRAIFDADVSMGEAFVLTPFQMVLESLPRPAVRSMSVSWVVKETDSRFNVPNPANEEKERCFKVKGMARGCGGSSSCLLGGTPLCKTSERSD